MVHSLREFPQYTLFFYYLKYFFVLRFQRLAIELFRRQTSRSSSPPDMRLTAGTTASERDPCSVKSDDDIQSTLSNNTKKGDDDDRTQHDDSNVSTESVRHEAFIT